jgi:hypothetical protein
VRARPHLQPPELASLVCHAFGPRADGCGAREGAGAGAGAGGGRLRRAGAFSGSAAAQPEGMPLVSNMLRPMTYTGTAGSTDDD